MSQVDLRTALVDSVIVAATGGLTVLTTYTQSHSWEVSGVAGGTAALVLILRMAAQVGGQVVSAVRQAPPAPPPAQT
jgi:hypothetical protein